MNLTSDALDHIRDSAPIVAALAGGLTASFTIHIFLGRRRESREALQDLRPELHSAAERYVRQMMFAKPGALLIQSLRDEALRLVDTSLKRFPTSSDKIPERFKLKLDFLIWRIFLQDHERLQRTGLTPPPIGDGENLAALSPDQFRHRVEGMEPYVRRDLTKDYWGRRLERFDLNQSTSRSEPPPTTEEDPQPRTA